MPQLACFVAPLGRPYSIHAASSSFLCTPSPAASSQFRNGVCVSRNSSKAWRACTGIEVSGEGSTEGTSASSSPVDELRWSEIPFASLQAELQAIEDYIEKEEIDTKNPWPVFLRGAAYEYWGRTQLAVAQYELLAPYKGMLLVPELWVRKAYCAFKLGEVVVADRYHDVAQLIRAEAVGNMMHFSAMFEANFREHMPKQNGPVDTLQKAICNYCNGRAKDGRNSAVVNIVGTPPTPQNGVHSSLWFLACCARSQFTASIDGAILAQGDTRVARAHLEEVSEIVDPVLQLIADLYLGKKTLDEVEAAVSAGEKECSMSAALYLALYYDAYLKKSEGRDKWLEVANEAPQPESSRGIDDYMYWTVKHRLSVPPGAKSDLAPPQVPT